MLCVSLVREVIWWSRVTIAAYRVLPALAVAPFPDDVHSLTFAGLGGDARQMTKSCGGFPNAAVLLHRPVQPESLHDPSEIITTFNIRFMDTGQLDIGQENNVQYALSNTRHWLHKNPSKRLVLFGTSRGAAVALQVAAHLTAEEIARVPLVICEGIFTTVEDVIDTRFPAFLRPVVRVALFLFTAYRSEANARWSPLAAARTFPHRALPVVFVRSLADTVVVPACTAILVDVMRAAGATHVREIILQTSDHSSYSSHNVADRARYVNALNYVYADVFKQDFKN